MSVGNLEIPLAEHSLAASHFDQRADIKEIEWVNVLGIGRDSTMPLSGAATVVTLGFLVRGCAHESSLSERLNQTILCESNRSTCIA